MPLEGNLKLHLIGGKLDPSGMREAWQNQYIVKNQKKSYNCEPGLQFMFQQNEVKFGSQEDGDSQFILN